MSKGTPAGRPKGIHTKKRPIEETIEILILQYLAKHNPNDYTFQDYAKNKTDILGSQSKKASNSQQALRLKINQRIFYLKNHKKSLFRLLRKKGLNTFEGRDIPIDDINTDQEEEDDINSNLCKFSVRFYFTLRLGNVKASNRHRIIGFRFSYKKLHYHNSLVLFSTNLLLFPFSILLTKLAQCTFNKKRKKIKKTSNQKKYHHDTQ
jgi:hypothetical protein